MDDENTLINAFLVRHLIRMDLLKNDILFINRFAEVFKFNTDGSLGIHKTDVKRAVDFMNMESTWDVVHRTTKLQLPKFEFVGFQSKGSNANLRKLLTGFYGICASAVIQTYQHILVTSKMGDHFDTKTILRLLSTVSSVDEYFKMIDQ